MRKDSVLAGLESITPDDLKVKPLILSQQDPGRKSDSVDRSGGLRPEYHSYL